MQSNEIILGENMKKSYFYDFRGSVSLETDSQAEAEKLVTGISLNQYLINEQIYETDEFHVPIDINIRKDIFDTHFHPLDDGEEFEEFKLRKCRYGKIIDDFLHGYFGKMELLKKMEEAETDEDGLEDCPLYAEIKYVDLKDQEGHTLRLVAVD